MAFTMHVETGNAAFYRGDDGDDTPEGEHFEPGPELVRILQATARQVDDGFTSGILNDSNGNRVGSWEITEGDQ
jgi:hypothetical protein